MLSVITLHGIDEVDLKDISEQMNKIMQENRFKREPFDKEVFVRKENFSRETSIYLLSKKAFLIMHTMD